jgi:hypothetical protein
MSKSYYSMRKQIGTAIQTIIALVGASCFGWLCWTACVPFSSGPRLTPLDIAIAAFFALLAALFFAAAVACICDATVKKEVKNP